MESQIENKEYPNILLYPCPIEKYSEYFITVSSINSEESFLSIYKLTSQIEENNIKQIKKIPISEKFTSVSWTSYKSETKENSFGFLIGGHSNGSISLWNIETILNNLDENPEENLGCIYNENLFSKSINVISVNNEKNNLFAIGNDNISILSIDEKYSCSIILNCEIENQKNEEFISLNWNPKVNYILASGTNKGMTYIFDMKKKKLFLSISEQSLLNNNDENENEKENLKTNLIWYNDGAQIIISYEDSEYNYMLQYHMKQSKIPSALFENGHSNTILFLDKNKYDKNFLLTLGKDNFVICWNLKSKKIIDKVKLKCDSLKVFWCGKVKDCFIYLGKDNQIYYDRINFTKDDNLNNIFENNNIPNWMFPIGGLSFSFDGKLYKFSRKENNIIKISKLKKDIDMNNRIKNFCSKIDNNESITSLLEEKINSNLKHDKHTNKTLFYISLKGILTNDEKLIFNEMGLDKEKLLKEIDKSLGKKNKKEKIPQSYIPIIDDDENENVESIFDNEPIQTIKKTFSLNEDEEEEKIINENYQRNTNWNVGNEKLIKNSLLLGELESAVELLFKNERYSEGLIIASLDNNLFKKAKEDYFKFNKDLFVKKFFPAIIDKNFELMLKFGLNEWKEYLFYAKNNLDKNQFENFSEKLGDKLHLFSKKDIYPSLICYSFSRKIDKILNLICEYYFKEIENDINKNELLQNSYEDIMISYIVFKSDLNGNLSDDCRKLIYDYVLVLVNEGFIFDALKNLNYVRNDNDIEIEELYNRLYYNCDQDKVKNFSKPKNFSNNIFDKSKKNKLDFKNKSNILNDDNKNILNNNKNDVINDYFKEVKKEEYKEINKEDNIFPRKMPPPKKFMPPKKNK